MKNWKSKLMSALLCAGLIVSSAAPALACTGIYIGSGLTANGSSYMGRSEDFGIDYVKIFDVSPAADYPEDYIYTDTYGFSWPLGGHMYAYTYCKDSPGQGETMTDENGDPIFEAYAEAGQNEKGVTVTATVTIGYNAAAKAADPLVETGLCEISIGTLILGKAATAKEGVDLMAKIIDQEGSGECNSLMIADPKETWYFCQLSGHQYAAVKLPEDKVSIQPNITLFDVIDVNDTENVVASPGLVSLAQENGFLVTDGSGKINVAKTYAEGNSGAGQYVRYYQGLYYIDPQAAEDLGWTVTVNEKGRKQVVKADGSPIQNSEPDNGLDLLLDTDKTFTTMDVFKLLATRGEETDGFNANTDGVYSIGNEHQAECHVFETRPGQPHQLATIQWQTMGPAEFGVFLPYYSALVSDVAQCYKFDDVDYAEGSMYWDCCKLYSLCISDRENCGAAVKAYFDAYQQSLIDQQTAVDAEMAALYAADPAAAAAKATELGKSLAEQFYQTTLAVTAELEAYIAAGDTSAPFALSAAVTDVMPVYAQPETAQVPATGDAILTWTVLALCAMAGLCVLLPAPAWKKAD